MRSSLSRAALVVVAGAALVLLPALLPAQDLTDRLAIHGYLTQGCAISDSHQVIGIPKGGTFDYRRAAVVLRLKGTAKDAFVVQLSDRQLGESPANDLESTVELDWAFYEHRFDSRTTLRVGKEPIPLGIFNEIRYVGTLLPFYRAPYGFYEEGANTSETIDGVVLTRQLTDKTPWKLTASAYGGSFRYLQSGTRPSITTNVPEYMVEKAQAKNVLGAQLWLNTPVTGLRFGVGGDRRDDHGPVYGNDSSGSSKGVWASADGNFNRFATRFEFRKLVLGRDDGVVHSWYAQAGYRITDQIAVNVQRDQIDYAIELQSGELDLPYDKDNAIGINYAFTPAVIFKLEGHDNTGYIAEEPLNLLGPPTHAKYLITSLSVSF